MCGRPRTLPKHQRTPSRKRRLRSRAEHQWPVRVARKKKFAHFLAPDGSSPGFVFTSPGQEALRVAPGSNHPRSRTALSLGYSQALYSHRRRYPLGRLDPKKAKTQLTNNGGYHCVGGCLGRRVQCRPPDVCLLAPIADARIRVYDIWDTYLEHT